MHSSRPVGRPAVHRGDPVTPVLPPLTRFRSVAGVVEPAEALDALVDETRDAIIANDDIRALRATDELRALAHRMRGAL